MIYWAGAGVVGGGSAFCCCGRIRRMACTSSATAANTNWNCCLEATLLPRWSLMCSSVAAMSISFAPFAMRFSTMSSRQYVPVRPTPSLHKIITLDRCLLVVLSEALEYTLTHFLEALSCKNVDFSKKCYSSVFLLIF